MGGWVGGHVGAWDGNGGRPVIGWVDGREGRLASEVVAGMEGCVDWVAAKWRLSMRLGNATIFEQLRIARNNGVTIATKQGSLFQKTSCFHTQTNNCKMHLLNFWAIATCNCT